MSERGGLFLAILNKCNARSRNVGVMVSPVCFCFPRTLLNKENNKISALNKIKYHAINSLLKLIIRLESQNKPSFLPAELRCYLGADHWLVWRAQSSSVPTYVLPRHVMLTTSTPATAMLLLQVSTPWHRSDLRNKVQ